MADESAGAAPATVVVGLTEPQLVDLVESWLRAEPDLRFGKARAAGGQLRLQITRRQFGEAKRRIGITASTTPHPDHRRARQTRNAKTSEPAPALPAAVIVPAPPKAERRVRLRRRRRSINLAGLSNLAETLEAIVAERDRARVALQEIARIVKGLR